MNATVTGTGMRQSFSQLLSSPHGPRIASAINATFHTDDVREAIALRPKKQQCPCDIIVTTQDPVVAAWESIYRNQRPAIHVPAHLKRPGGYWWNEGDDVETDVCLRSTLVMALEDRFGYDPERNWQYPLTPWSMLYTPDTFFFKDENGQLLTDNPPPLWIPVITAGVRATITLRKDGSLSTTDRRRISALYEGIFFLAEQFQHTALVLYGLLGIDDGFGYPPLEVMNLLKRALQFSNLQSVVVCVPYWSASNVEKLRTVLRR